MDNGLVLWYSLLLGATLSVLILIVVDNGLVLVNVKISTNAKFES